MTEMRNVYKILIGKPQGTWPLGTLTRRWKNNIRWYWILEK